MKIASLGALDLIEERDEVFNQYVQFHEKDELSVQLDKLNFNNQDVGKTTSFELAQ